MSKKICKEVKSGLKPVISSAHRFTCKKCSYTSNSEEKLCKPKATH